MCCVSSAFGCLEIKAIKIIFSVTSKHTAVILNTTVHPVQSGCMCVNIIGTYVPHKTGFQNFYCRKSKLDMTEVLMNVDCASLFMGNVSNPSFNPKTQACIRQIQPHGECTCTYQLFITFFTVSSLTKIKPKKNIK